MRYLSGAEKDMAITYARAAYLVAIDSTCEKSKRGVVIVKNYDIIGKGTNNPPGNLECDIKKCYDVCRDYAVHAEQNAILDALSKGHSLENSRLYHIKFKDGIPQISGEPSCVECSKLILQSGIEEVVLDQKVTGFALYTAEEFHLASLESLKLRTSKN